MPIIRVTHPEITALRARGLNLMEAHLKYAASGGACAICGDDSVVLVVDHQHGHCRRSSGCRGCVRGLLCPPCNVRVGRVERNFGFDPQPYIEYITKWAEVIS